VQTLGRRALEAAVERDRRQGRSIGLVPTMGFLHEGHASLLRRARSENDRVVLTIFVNPLQFGPTEDFERYPRDPEGDLLIAGAAGVDYVFAPEVADLYPHGTPATTVDVGRIGEVVEGSFRPGHFNGVATVCLKLFHICRPHRAYFGRKDAQQLAVIRQVVADLDVPIDVVACETVRDDDGLAMSSRNSYLDPSARSAAAVLWRALTAARDLAAGGERDAAALRAAVERVVATEPAVRMQYVEVVDPATFEPVESVTGAATIALAALVGSTRLIDNVDINVGTGRRGHAFKDTSSRDDSVADQSGPGIRPEPRS
jgi:pantoate--beta-alanine ligase